MADCNETLRELYQYLDGELSDADRTHIQQHLDDCSPCLAAYDFEAELRIVVRNRCTDQVPDALRARIAKAIELEP
jgi:mycothiol system anti-sigma-R factor